MRPARIHHKAFDFCAVIFQPFFSKAVSSSRCRIPSPLTRRPNGILTNLLMASALLAPMPGTHFKSDTTSIRFAFSSFKASVNASSPDFIRALRTARRFQAFMASSNACARSLSLRFGRWFSFSFIATSYFNSLSQTLSSACAACFQRPASARPFQSAMNFSIASAHPLSSASAHLLLFSSHQF